MNDREVLGRQFSEYSKNTKLLKNWESKLVKSPSIYIVHSLKVCQDDNQVEFATSR